MSDIKEQIFHELSVLEDAVSRVRGEAVIAERQTDLEVAILTEQVKNLRERNKRASDLIDKSLIVLKKLQ